MSDWLTVDKSADAAILDDYLRLRARSRELLRNDPYAVQFRRIVTNNVIGSRPVKLKSCARTLRGKDDGAANARIEEAWMDWQRPENCGVTGALCYHDIERMVLSAVVGDGFTFARLVRGFDNGYGFALQLWESDHLDTDFNRSRLEGRNEVRGGVELDGWGRAVAYYFFGEHPNHSGLVGNGRGLRSRMSADDFLMVTKRDRPEQTFGAPWLAPAMVNIRHLNGYQEAALVEARAGSAKMGFIERDEDEFGPDDEEDGTGEQLSEIEPGMVEYLKKGEKWKGWDPSNPNGNMPGFVKTVLRGVAAGVGVSYNTLANDLEGVNYSSLREQRLQDTDAWRALQHWWIEGFEVPVHRAWFRMASLSGALHPLPAGHSERLCRPQFIGRGWDWVDPAKEIKAMREAVELGVDTRQDILARRSGKDLDEVVEQLKKEEEALDDAGLSEKPETAPVMVGGGGEEEGDA